MVIHDLKISDKYYKDVATYKKNFEVRKNDRNFQVGDELVLREWDGARYTGRKHFSKIIYILRDKEYVPKDHVILGLQVKVRN